MDRARKSGLEAKGLQQELSQIEIAASRASIEVLRFQIEGAGQRLAVRGRGRGKRCGTAVNLEGMAKELHADPLRSMAPKLIFGNQG
jgi:hypothetical protein